MADEVVYALYGPVHNPYLELWNRTWLQGKSFVYIPDAPLGPFAHFYHPVHHGRSGGSFLGKTRVDANMLWAAQAANHTFPNARWVMVVDSDAFVFTRTVESIARKRDWRLPTTLGVFAGGGVSRQRGESCLAAPRCQRHNGDGNYAPIGNCCMCAVSNGADGSFVLDPNGTSFYRPVAKAHSPYGGTGILLSKSLLDAIPSDAWELCARRLVCGSADFRLGTCIVNLLDGVEFVSVDANHKFLRAAFAADQAARSFPKGSMDVYFNAFWSVLHKDPIARAAIMSFFRSNTSCPWSMHKLHARYVSDVFSVAQHCV
jgi:hypothetical protein